MADGAAGWAARRGKLAMQEGSCGQGCPAGPALLSILIVRRAKEPDTGIADCHGYPWETRAGFRWLRGAESPPV